MTILATAPMMIFGLGGLVALIVLAVCGYRAVLAWGELTRALADCADARPAHATIRIFELAPARPQLRVIEGGIGGEIRLPVAAPRHGLRAAA